ncbi:MAG: hypothetical protein HC933_15480, partial [Pleurocapsa sp. SU_196_0]|nr:hypothetical protein [Pleurocapsa sp. SU_196_0]
MKLPAVNFLWPEFLWLMLLLPLLVLWYWWLLRRRRYHPQEYPPHDYHTRNEPLHMFSPVCQGWCCLT